MIGPRLAKTCTLSLVLATYCTGIGFAQENNASVTRGVGEFNAAFKAQGMPGVIARLAECWKDVMPNPSQDRVALCFTIDYIASDFSEFNAKRRGGSEPDDLVKIERVLARVNTALKRMKVEQSDRGKLIAGWIKLSAMVVAANENPDARGTRDADQPTFDKARQAVLAKIQNPSAAKFTNVQKLNVIDYKGVMTTVVCGTVDYKRRQDTKSAPRRFVYFVKDREAYVDTGSGAPVDIGPEIIKNFCS
ncbi:hypothetical protein [Bradyrhizobium betae]|uniref:Uncharacterized protein n=1 Tax=Bradyrhizobium betae TaxID=244734 RepID=A0A5P6P4Q3_9BRAD|nr:hypothetical protein [Bradyrhizobium betae]MCS3731218.1 hypothetical protein [Bradyrhizobium betae]QFI73176.1 hypothetical protein F8237_12685 [Bradyrhizobium betae]